MIFHDFQALARPLLLTTRSPIIMMTRATIEDGLDTADEVPAEAATDGSTLISTVAILCIGAILHFPAKLSNAHLSGRSIACAVTRGGGGGGSLTCRLIPLRGAACIRCRGQRAARVALRRPPPRARGRHAGSRSHGGGRRRHPLHALRVQGGGAEPLLRGNPAAHARNPVLTCRGWAPCALCMGRGRDLPDDSRKGAPGSRIEAHIRCCSEVNPNPTPTL